MQQRIPISIQRICCASSSPPAADDDTPSNNVGASVPRHSSSSNITRPKKRNLLIIILFLLGFVCLVSYYLLVVIHRQGPAGGIQQLLMAMMEDNLSFVNREQFDEGGKLENNDGTNIEPIVERYQLVHRYEQQDKLAHDDPAVSAAAVPFKRILFWNDFFGIPDFRLGLGRHAFRKWGCPVWQCETSTNRTDDVHDYDAVVFHMRSWNPEDLPQRRTPRQRYVFWILESAGWTEYLDTSQLGNYFNWTLTYRWDSDMVMPYGYVRPTGNVPLHPNKDQLNQLISNQKVNYAKGKTKMAAWMVSNCESRSNRQHLVSQLQKYIQVDVYGNCGNLTCPKRDDENNSSEECRDVAGRNYKFYMALENTLCRDYITEKFFAMLQRPVIPIVFGLHDHYDQMAPPHSFINAAKFENVRQLADYLMLLDSNDTLYNQYFWWKPHFESRYKQKDVNIGMCHLCASLHSKLPPKVYPNMSQWWDEQSSCVTSPPIS